VLLKRARSPSRAPAAETGVAQERSPTTTPTRRLEQLSGRARGMMTASTTRQTRSEADRFPEGDQEKIIRAAKILIDEGLASILLVKREVVAPLLKETSHRRIEGHIIDIERCAHRTSTCTYCRRSASVRISMMVTFDSSM